MSLAAAQTPPPPSARSRRALFLRVLVALALLALAFGYLRTLNRKALLEALRGANPWLLALSAGGNALLVWSKARRAQLLLAPTANVRMAALTECYLGSYAADNLLMSQAGLAVRVVLLRLEGVPVATGAALQALEKLIEAAGLLVVVPLAPLGGGLPTTGTTRSMLLVGAGVAIAALVWLRLRGARSRFVAQALSAARALRDPRTALACAALTVFGWAVELAMVLATFRALGLPVSRPAAALVVIAVNFAALVPGLPGNLGTFEAAAVVALGAASVDRTHALGFAFVYHVLHTVPVTLPGLRGLRRALAFQRSGRPGRAR